MDQEEQSQDLSVLARLNRLDRLVELLEEPLEEPNRDSDSFVRKNEECCITIAAALKEASSKGTIIQRLTALENKVLQLVSELDVGNTSSSSSSSISSTIPSAAHPHELQKVPEKGYRWKKPNHIIRHRNWLGC